MMTFKFKMHLLNAYRGQEDNKQESIENSLMMEWLIQMKKFIILNQLVEYNQEEIPWIILSQLISTINPTKIQWINIQRSWDVSIQISRINKINNNTAILICLNSNNKDNLNNFNKDNPNNSNNKGKILHKHSKTNKWELPKVKCKPEHNQEEMHRETLLISWQKQFKILTFHQKDQLEAKDK